VSKDESRYIHALAVSICDIWPIFSSSVIRLRRSCTRSLMGCFASLYLTYSAANAADGRRRKAKTRHATAVAAVERVIAVVTATFVDSVS
jgi:hypothetical protein